VKQIPNLAVVMWIGSISLAVFSMKIRPAVFRLK
jgi:hypothetical protein